MRYNFTHRTLFTYVHFFVEAVREELRPAGDETRSPKYPQEDECAEEDEHHDLVLSNSPEGVVVLLKELLHGPVALPAVRLYPVATVVGFYHCWCCCRYCYHYHHQDCYHYYSTTVDADHAKPKGMTFSRCRDNYIHVKTNTICFWNYIKVS